MIKLPQVILATKLDTVLVQGGAGNGRQARLGSWPARIRQQVELQFGGNHHPQAHVLQGLHGVA
ncbi:MAG: hypothetical protein O7F73_01520 [Gammaproteobacteria bacterium]|nr:hypothetical protein [Gammaproteobacteria bacterium]